MTNVVIVGGSVAGMKLAQNLRSEGYDGSITLVDAEDNPLYDKPPLSKDYLSGASSIESISLLSRAELDAQGVTTRFGVAAVAFDPAKQTIALSDGSILGYDWLVVATGARARRTAWSSQEGVYVLRTRADADALRTELIPGRHLAVIGAGFIGAEAAATALKAGMNVTLIEPLAAPMGRAMNSTVGGIFASKHVREGAQFCFGVAVEDVRQLDGRRQLLLTDGSTLEVDAVLLGIGAVPNTDWLESSGVSVDNGVLCDATMAVEGVSAVYAIGDVARFSNDRHPDSVRHEHWTSAVDQAILVAHNIAHPDEPRRYDPTPYVWTDQYDWKIQIVGLTGSDHWTLIGDPDDDRFAIVYGIEGQPVQGAVVVNWPRALVDARRSVAAGAWTEDLTDRLRSLLGALQQRR